MEITGTLLDFPLPELLQFLGSRRVTGCLSLTIASDHYMELHPQQYGIWLSQGNVVSAQRSTYPQDVYTLAVQREWITPFVARKLKERSPKNVPAGLYLESQSVLDFGQLRSLFFREVVHRVEALCKVRNATFTFRASNEPPINQMTGLSIAATKLAKQGIKGNLPSPKASLNHYQGRPGDQLKPLMA